MKKTECGVMCMQADYCCTRLECDDQLQHTISTHLHSDHAIESVDLTPVKNSLEHAQEIVPDDQAAAVYCHLTL